MFRDSLPRSSRLKYGIGLHQTLFQPKAEDAPGTPSLTSPANASETTDRTPTFSWGAVEGATLYQIQIDNNNNFSSPLFDELVVAPTFTPPGDVAYNVLYWRVRVDEPAESEWSATRSVTVKPIAPTLSSPADDPTGTSKLVDYTPALVIASAIPDVALHRWQVATDSGFSAIVLNQTETAPTTTHTPASDLTYAVGGFWWRVRAEAASGVVSDWSTAQQFQLHTYESYHENLSPIIQAHLDELTADPLAINEASVYRETPVVILNDSFDSWVSNDAPTGWTEVNESAGVRQVDQVASGQSHANVGVDAGTGAANIWTTDTTVVQIRHSGSPALAPGDTIRVRVPVSFKSGGNTMGISSSGNLPQAGRVFASGVGTLDTMLVPDSNSTQVILGDVNQTGPGEATFDSVLAEKYGRFDGVPANLTKEQTGLRGTGSAYDMNGTTSRIIIVNGTEVQGNTQFYFRALIKLDGAGEGNQGIIAEKSGSWVLRINSSSRDLTATINFTGGGAVNAVATTTTTLSTGTWYEVILTMGTDNVPHIYINGVEATYATQTTGSGTRVSNTNNITIGNNVAQSATLDGLIDDYGYDDREMTAGEAAISWDLANRAT